MSIDFQARLDRHARGAIKETAAMAIYLLNQDFVWQYDVGIQGDKIGIVVWGHGILMLNDAELPNFTFNLANRTIDAALLEQLHNEVTAWFTAIKEGVSA